MHMSTFFTQHGFMNFALQSFDTCPFNEWGRDLSATHHSVTTVIHVVSLSAFLANRFIKMF
jgi:hypothetical protein